MKSNDVIILMMLAMTTGVAFVMSKTSTFKSGVQGLAGAVAVILGVITVGFLASRMFK